MSINRQTYLKNFIYAIFLNNTYFQYILYLRTTLFKTRIHTYMSMPDYKCSLEKREVFCCYVKISTFNTLQILIQAFIYLPDISSMRWKTSKNSACGSQQLRWIWKIIFSLIYAHACIKTHLPPYKLFKSIVHFKCMKTIVAYTPCHHTATPAEIHLVLFI